METIIENVNNQDLQCVNRTLIGLFMHYDNGDMVNIQDLSKPEYEKFLEQMNKLRMTYITLTNHP